MIKISATIKSSGDDWPEDEIKAIREFFEGRGYQSVAQGSADNLEHGGHRWWEVHYEKKLDDEATEEDLDSSAEVPHPSPLS